MLTTKLHLHRLDEEKSVEMCASVNAKVEALQNAVLTKRGDYASYNECVRVKTGHFACEQPRPTSTDSTA